MKRKNGIASVLPACAVLALLTLGAQPGAAGDLTTDGLTVNADASFRGEVTIGAPGSGSIPTNGLVLYYNFTTNQGSSVADNSGNGYTGVVTDAVWDGGGLNGGCYAFDGDGDYINTTFDTGGLVASGQFTISMWYNLNDGQSDSYAYFFGTRDSSSSDNRLYALLYSNDSGYPGLIDWGVMPNGAQYTFYSDYRAADGPSGWHHLVISADQANEEYHLYIDGVEDANGPVSYPGLDYSAYANSDPLYLGTLLNNGSPVTSQCLDGKLDEFRIYDRTLTDAEVEGLYLSGATPNPGAGHLAVAVISSSSSNATISVTDPTRFESGVSYQPSMGDLIMGTFTNAP